MASPACLLCGRRHCGCHYCRSAGLDRLVSIDEASNEANSYLSPRRECLRLGNLRVQSMGPHRAAVDEPLILSIFGVVGIGVGMARRGNGT